jgi:hypothetical protein
MARPHRSKADAGRTPSQLEDRPRNQGHPPDKQAKRRPHSRQEIEDGARSDPSNREDPRSGYPDFGTRAQHPADDPDLGHAVARGVAQGFAREAGSVALREILRAIWPHGPW